MICQSCSMLTSLQEKKEDRCSSNEMTPANLKTDRAFFFLSLFPSPSHHNCSKSPLAQVPQHSWPSPAVQVFITTISGAWQLYLHLVLEVLLLLSVPWHYMCWPMTDCLWLSLVLSEPPLSGGPEYLWYNRMSCISLNLTLAYLQRDKKQEL